MQHYFIDKEHKASDYFEFSDNIIGLELCLSSCDSIFSKNKIDDGTRALINAIDKHIVLSGKGLDLGCGLGVIGISLMKKYNLKIDMVDINKTAVELAKQNLKKNGLNRYTMVEYSDGFSAVNDNYDFIVSNPPIKVGKKVLFKLMEDAFKHLNDNGQLIIVIRKDLGMESLKKHIISICGNCEIIKRDKGFYILRAINNPI